MSRSATTSTCKTWLFAGAGGNAMSGAEIILDNTKNARVVMVARDQPDGLFENKQQRDMAERYGDDSFSALAAKQGVVLNLASSQRRLHIELVGKINLARPELRTRADGSQQFEMQEADGKTRRPVMHEGRPLVGDMFVTALGSPGQFPPEIGALVLQARRADPLASRSKTSLQ